MEWLSRKITVIYPVYETGIEESGKTGEKRGEDWTLTVPSLFFIRRRRRRSDFFSLLFSFCALFMNRAMPVAIKKGTLPSLLAGIPFFSFLSFFFFLFIIIAERNFVSSIRLVHLAD